MADNITCGTQTGSGPILASDQNSSTQAHYPKGKLVFGADNTFTDVELADGLPVQPATGAAWVLGASSAAIGTVELGVTSLAALETISLASLPAGAATAAKQPALGVAGTPSADVISVQGVVDGQAVDVTAVISPADDFGGTNVVNSTGSITTLVCDGVSAVAVVITGTFVGTIVFEGSVDGVNNVSVPAIPLGGGAAVTSATAAGIWVANVAGLGTFGVRCSAYTSGTAAVHVRSSQFGLAPVYLAAALPAGANNIGTVELSATALAALETITVASVTAPLAAGTNNIGDVDVLTLPALPAGSNLIGGVIDTPTTSGGLSMHNTVSVASTNATSVKGSAGQVYGLQVFNLNAAARYLKLYNKASAPTVGTDTPVKTILIPGNTAGSGAVIPFDKGLAFSTGIAFALTTGIAHADTGAVAASEIVVGVDYK